MCVDHTISRSVVKTTHHLSALAGMNLRCTNQRDLRQRNRCVWGAPYGGPMDELRLYTFVEAGEVLRVSYKTVQQYVADRELCVVNVATKSSTGQRARLRVREDDLRAFIEGRTT